MKTDARRGSDGSRALFVLHHLRVNTGGMTKAWLDRVRLFAEAGWDVHVALITPDPALPATLDALRADGRLPRSVVVHARSSGRRRLPVLPFGRRSRDLTRPVPEWLDELAGPGGALVFADSPASYPLVARMRNPSVAKLYAVHLSHLSAAAHRLDTPAAVANGELTSRFARLSEDTMRAADRIVVLTHAQKQDFLLRWGANLPVDVIGHCADPFDLPDQPYDPRLVVGLGRLSWGKRWEHAIRAMARVVATVPDARLVMYGVGDEEGRLRALVERIGLRDSVTFAGYTTSPKEAMSQAACVVSTTRREGMPLVLLECLSVGTPVVVYDVRYGPREVVRDGVDGFVLPAGDIQGTAEAVVRLLTEPGLRDRMSAAAHEVTTRFSREQHDEAWLELGQELYDQRAAPRAPVAETS